MKTEEQEFLEYCINYFGVNKQEVVAIEEMAELTQQLSKFIINHSNKSREKLLEEFVDVTIMLNQLKIIFGITDEEIETNKNFKLTRLGIYIQRRIDAGIQEKLEV
jgi:hypothetical protein